MPAERPNRGAERFDAFRRELIRAKLPVQKDERKQWEARFKEFVEAALPDPRKLFQKPGLAARLFAAEVELPNSHPRDLEVFAQQLDLVWEAKLPKGVEEWRTLTSPDRRDLVWEFAVDLGASYVTGSVKLRNYPFERPEPRDRERSYGDRTERRPYQRRDDRPYQRRDDDRPSRPYQKRDDDRPSRPYQKRDDGDRPSRPYQKRDGDRPSRPYQKRDDGDRPTRPYQKRDGDRPSRPYQKRDDGDRPKRPYQKRDDGDKPKRPYQKRDDKPSGYRKPSGKPPYKRKPKE